MAGEVRTAWWWVRHARVTASPGRLYGASDPPAALDDHDQLSALAAALPEGAVWLTSALRRARDTASAIRACGLGGDAPLVEPAFGEQSFGSWQGRTHAEIARMAGKPRHRYWYTTPDHLPPEGESFLALIARVVAAIEAHTAAHAGRDIVAVAHGGPIRAAVAHALGLDAERALAFVTDNLSTTRLDHVRRRLPGAPWQVRFVNRTPCSP
jgi:alpha-ribazole phosphatase